MTSIKPAIGHFVNDVIRRIVRSRLAQTRFSRQLFFQIAQGFSPILVSDIGPAVFYVSTSDIRIGRDVFRSGGFESGFIENIFHTLAALGYTDFSAKTFIDIGANIGTSSIPLMKKHMFAQAVAFEPEPTNYSLLSLNIIANGLQGTMTAHPLALSDTQAMIPFEISPINSGDHRVRIDPASARIKGPADRERESERRVITVQATTFDHLVESNILSPHDMGLVWIDTQGHESQVLTGAQTLLASTVPVLMEYWPYQLERTDSLTRLEKVLQKHYSFFIDVRETKGAARDNLTPISEIIRWPQRYPVGTGTDLLLLKDRGNTPAA